MFNMSTPPLFRAFTVFVSCIVSFTTQRNKMAGSILFSVAPYHIISCVLRLPKHLASKEAYKTSATERCWGRHSSM